MSARTLRRGVATLAGLATLATRRARVPAGGPGQRRHGDADARRRAPARRPRLGAAAAPAHPGREHPRADDPRPGGRPALHGRHAGDRGRRRDPRADRPLPRRQRDAHRPQLRRHPGPGPGRRRDAGRGDAGRDRRRPAAGLHRPGGRRGPGAARARPLDHPLRAGPGRRAARPGCGRGRPVGRGAAPRRREHEPRAGRSTPCPARPRPPSTRRSASSTGSTATTPRRVARHGTAFARGMADAGVVPTAKHFPGLGRVRANTDVVVRVTDPVTGAARPVPRAVPAPRSGRGCPP